MFDGTDLNLAYGPPSAMGNDQGAAFPVQPPPQQSNAAPVIEQMAPSPQPAPQQMQAPQPPPVAEMQYIPTPPPAMFMQQMPVQSTSPSLQPPEDTLWDRISQKKLDVLKLFVLALVVLLGISMDRLMSFYISNYVSSSVLSDFQEFLVRLSYPIIVLVVLWLIKATV